MRTKASFSSGSAWQLAKRAIAASLGLVFLTAPLFAGKIESSVLDAVDYNARAKTLVVEFHSGPKYRYFDVPPTVYKSLMAAESKGHFFFYNIRKNYRSERVQPASGAVARKF